MIRTLALIKRREGVAREAFRDHYEQVHAPLARPLLDGLERYVRYHVSEDLFGEVGFDVLTSFRYRSREAVDRLLADLSGDAGAAIRADELGFMDKPANRFFPVSERVLRAGEMGEEHVFVLLSRPVGMSRFEASKTLLRDAWPALAEALPGPGCVVLRDAFAMAGREPPWDAVLQLPAPSPAQSGRLHGWLRAQRAAGHTLCAVRTRRFETQMSSLAVPRREGPVALARRELVP